jgi:6-phosphogluconate dehydrogenase
MTVTEAVNRYVPSPTIAAALDARYLSGLLEERLAASKILHGPNGPPSAVDKAQVIADVRAALYCAKICSYAQGLNIIRAASVVSSLLASLFFFFPPPPSFLM